MYLIGAGASKAMFDLPVMAEFFKPFDQSKYPHLTAFMNSYFRPTWEEQGCHPSLEEVVTALELRNDQFGSFGQEIDYKATEARRELDRFLLERLAVIGAHNKAKAILSKIGIEISEFANKEEIDRTIISLNYDLGLDTVLREVSTKTQHQELKHGTILERMYSILGQTRVNAGDRPSIYWKYKNKGYYLKLHGSLDWLFCSNANCYNHQQFFPNYFPEPDSNDRIGDPCGLCGTPLSPVIVPPTLLKSFDKFPKLGLLWNLASKELSEAQRIIVFGISFSSSDYYLRWLIRSSLNSNIKKEGISIEVININRDTCAILKTLTGVEPVYREEMVTEILK